jgi:hypothetical protein
MDKTSLTYLALRSIFLSADYGACGLLEEVGEGCVSVSAAYKKLKAVDGES